MANYRRTVLLSIVLLVGVVTGCPTGISPCKCTDTLPGVTIDCTSASSSSAVADVFSKDWPNPHFDFFQVVPLTGTSALDALPDNLFGGKSFLHCWIGDSNIASIGDSAFAGMEDTLLEILLGRAEKLTSFPGASLEPFTMLYKVQVMASAITTVNSFGATPQLAEVNLPNSAITSVDANAFNDLPRLAHVDLSNGKIEAVGDGWFASTSTVEWALYLTDNMITDVSPSAFSGTLPSSVFLGMNQLKTLSEESFKPLLEFMSTEDGGVKGHLDVRGNPLECDCSIQWLATDATFLPLVTGAICTNDDANGIAIGELPDDFFNGC